MPLLSQKRVSQTTRQDSSTSDLGGATNHSMSTYRDGSPRTGRTFNSSIDVRWGTQTTLLSSMRTNQSSSPRRPVHHTTRTRGPIQLIPSDFSDPTSLYSNLIIEGTEPVSTLRGLSTTSSRAATIRSVKSATRKLSSNHTMDHILPTATTQPPVSYPLSTWGPNSYTSTSNTPSSSSSWAVDATQASLMVFPPLLLQPSSAAQLSSRPSSSAAPTCTYIGTHPTTFGLRAAQAAQMAKVGGRGATYTLDRIASILVRYKGSSGPVARRAKRGRRRDVSSTIQGRFGKAVPTAISERLLSCTKYIRTVLGTFPSHNTPETSIIEPLGCLWYIDNDATPDVLDGTRPRRRQSRIGFNPSPLCSQLLTPCDPTVPPRSPAVSILVSTKSPHNHCTPTPRLESPRVTFTTTFVEDGEVPVVSLSPFSRQAPAQNLLDASPQALLMGPPIVSRTQELPRTVPEDDASSILYLHHPNAPVSEESPCQGARSPITIGANSSMYVDILSPPTTIHEGDIDPSEEDDEDSTRRLLVLGDEDGDDVPPTPSALSTSNEAPPPVPSGPGAKYHKGSRTPSHPHRSDDINTAGGCGVAGCTIQ